MVFFFFFPIELLFISTCFPSAAKQARRGVAFPLGKETDNEVTQKTFGWNSINCGSGGGLGECYFLNLHCRSVCWISCLTEAGCKPTTKF